MPIQRIFEYRDVTKPVLYLGQTKSRGKLIVKGEEMSSCKDLLFIQFAAEDLDRKNWFGLGRSDPFFTISRSR